MPEVQLLLGMAIAQSFIIRVDNKFSRQQVMTPMPKSSNNDIKFFVMCGVHLLSIIQLLTKISNWVVLLTKYSPYTNTWGITFHFKWFGKIKETHDRCLSHILFYPIESLSSHFCLNKLSLFHAVSDGGHNGTKPFDELAIEGSEPKKALNFMDIFGLGQIHNSLNFLGVSRNSLKGYYETRKTTLSVKKEHFLRLPYKLSFLRVIQTWVRWPKCCSLDLL